MNDIPISPNWCPRGTSIASLMHTCSHSLHETQFFSITTAIRLNPSSHISIFSASNGHTSTQNSQPVQSSSWTTAFGTSLGVSFGTTTSRLSSIASNGQYTPQTEQLMHRSGSM